MDVRVIAATHVNLQQAVADGKFRDDLYYRLNVIEIRIPPLRERREDIPLLADISWNASRTSWAKISAISPKARCASCWITTGRAMCANWRTPWSAPW